MNLLNLFKKGKNSTAERSPQKTASSNNIKKYAPSVSPAEQKYYQPDEYYTYNTYEDSPFAKKVITFEERKKISYPSKNGLYVAEILLLHYCAKGVYPHPAKGYPGFWWFTYGIRDVGKALESLETRGFISFSNLAESILGLTLSEIKMISAKMGLSQTGSKKEIAFRIAQFSSEQELIKQGIEKKYKLTKLGQQELNANQYIPYMHKHKLKTIEGSPFGYEFNVWSINKIIAQNPNDDWQNIVLSQEHKLPFHNTQK